MAKRFVTGTLAISTLLIAGCDFFSNDNDDKQEINLLTATSNVIDSGACVNGGTEFSAGLDTNENGSLDTDEISDSVQICGDTIVDSGNGHIYNIDELAFGDQRCSTGGFIIRAENNNKVVETATVCNSSADGTDDLINSVSANPASPAINDPFTLTVALARQPVENEIFSISWKNLTTDEVLNETTETINGNASATEGDITFEVTVTSDQGVEEKNQITISVLTSNTTSYDSVSTQSKQVSVPAEFEQPNAQPQGNFDGAMFFAGDNATAQSASTIKSSQARVNAIRAQALTQRAVASFVAERPTLSAGSDARSVLENFANVISSSQGFSLSNISTGQIGNGQVFLGIYRLESDVLKTPTEINNDLVQLIGINQQGGQITNLPSALVNEMADLNYRLYMTVVYLDQQTSDLSDDKVVVLSSLVRENELSAWENSITRFTSGRNVNAQGSIQTPGSSDFSVNASSQKADFLFVVDNSGSMSDNQQALADAADAFISVIESSGLDLNIGTINTGRSIELADTNQDGAFTSDLTEFKADVINQGTYGSATETGIYNSEQALLSVALGDSEDGVVTTEGHPREGAVLSVVILSDEQSQYTQRSSLGVEFDPQNNLFLDRHYTVYALVEGSDNNDSQYDDLAAATGGSFADIDNSDNFIPLMEEISKNAGGATNSFKLPENVDPSSLEVKKNGLVVPIAASSNDGWTYRPLSNTVLLRGTAKAETGDDVKIRYVTVN